MKIHTPPLQFLNEEVAKQWDEGLAKNQDAYGNGVYRYASEWATRMEAEIARGAKVADIAQRCSSEADNEGITGFMYGCAVQVLAGCWKWGEELRRWHNKDVQIGTEGDEANEQGGVLNPALLVIGEKSGDGQ